MQNVRVLSTEPMSSPRGFGAWMLDLCDGPLPPPRAHDSRVNNDGNKHVPDSDTLLRFWPCGLKMAGLGSSREEHLKELDAFVRLSQRPECLVKEDSMRASILALHRGDNECVGCG